MRDYIFASSILTGSEIIKVKGDVALLTHEYITGQLHTRTYTKALFGFEALSSAIKGISHA